MSENIKAIVTIPIVVIAIGKVSNTSAFVTYIKGTGGH